MSVETISISPTENSIEDSIDKIVQDCESVHNNTTETFNDDDNDNDNDNGTDKIEEVKEGVEGKQLMLPYYFPFSSLLSSTNPLWMSRSNCVFSDSLLTLTCTLAASSVKAYVLPFLLSRCRDYMIKRKESSGSSNDQYYDYLSLFSTYKYSGSLYKFSSSTGTDYFNKNHSESYDNNSHSSSSCCSVEKDSIKSHSMSDSYELDSIGVVVDDYGDDNSCRISHHNLSEKHLLAISNDFYEDECCEQVREARLDYIITQMDIARMARNASRHLDVESILALPTITYHKNRDLLSPITTSTSNTNINSKMDNNIGWSWQLIQDNVEDEQLEVNVDMDDTTTNATAQTQVSCVICLEHFKDGDKLRVLPCDHMFHIGCIDHWLLGTFSDDECFTFGCPTCKKNPASTHTNPNNLDLCMPVVNEETIISNENTEEENDNQSSSSSSTSNKVNNAHTPLDGSVPSWAFARIGNLLSRGGSESDSTRGSLYPSSSHHDDESE